MLKKLSVLFISLTLMLCGCEKYQEPEVPSSNEPLYYIESTEYGYMVYDDYIELTEFFGSSSETVQLPEKLYDAYAKVDKPLKVIGNAAFNENTGTRILVIPDSVTEIKSGAFHGCFGLETVTLGNNLTTIGNSAFHECSGIREIVIPDSVESIGDYAFNRCASMTKLSLGSGVTQIGEDAFGGCVSLEEVTGGESLNTIGSSAFEGTPWFNGLADEFSGIASVLLKYNGSASEITVPDTFTSVSDAFTGNETITSVALSESFKAIGNNAFAGCTKLKSINIPESVSYIGHSAFEGTPYFETLDNDGGFCIVGNGILIKYTGPQSGIKIPDDVKFISDAFRENQTLSEVRIGDNTETIGRDAFFRCPNLRVVFMSTTVKHIDEFAFDGSDIMEFHTSGNKYTEKWAKDYGLSNIITE